MLYKANWKFLGILLISFFHGTTFAEDLASAIASGQVTATFRGTGGSSGDTIHVTVRKKHAGDGSITLTVPFGLRLNSRNAGEQDMVISGVTGIMTGGESYSPRSAIEATTSPTTYVLNAYCAEFEKDNPSEGSGFTVGSVDPIAGCILSGAAGLSTEAKQAAIWIYTDKASFQHVNEKFSVSRSDWDSAQSVVTKCQAKGK